jgi:hypothetical protein
MLVARPTGSDPSYEVGFASEADDLEHRSLMAQRDDFGLHSGLAAKADERIDH